MFDCKTHRSILACLRPNQEEHPFRIRLGAPIIFSMKSFYKKILNAVYNSHRHRRSFLTFRFPGQEQRQQTLRNFNFFLLSPQPFETNLIISGTPSLLLPPIRHTIVR